MLDTRQQITLLLGPPALPCCISSVVHQVALEKKLLFTSSAVQVAAINVEDGQFEFQVGRIFFPVRGMIIMGGVFCFRLGFGIWHRIFLCVFRFFVHLHRFVRWGMRIEGVRKHLFFHIILVWHGSRNRTTASTRLHTWFALSSTLPIQCFFLRRHCVTPKRIYQSKLHVLDSMLRFLLKLLFKLQSSGHKS